MFFRAENINHIFSYIHDTFSTSLFSILELLPKTPILLLIIFFIVEWIGRQQLYAIANLSLKWKRPIRHLMYNAIVIAIIWFSGKEQQFIYFQF